MELSTPDFERLSPYSGQLGDELAGMVRDYAKQQRYTFMGPIKVHLEKADDLDTGLYRVRSRTLASSTEPQAPERPGGPAFPAGPVATAIRLPRRARVPRALLRCRPRRRPACAPAPRDQAPGPARLRARRPAAACGTGSRSMAPAIRSPARRWCWVGAEADVRIDNPGVSRRHCEIRTGTPSTIQDLGSTNGIVVDGQHTTRATLRDGSRIVVGSTTIIYRKPKGEAGAMSELTLTVMRLGFLAVLWLFVIVAVQVIRSDLFGTRVTQRGWRRDASRPQQAARQATPPPQRQQAAPPSGGGGRQRRGATTKLVTEKKAPVTGTTVALQGQTITLGRAHDSTIVLDDDYASSRHARIYPEPGRPVDRRGPRLHQWHVSRPKPTDDSHARSAGRADPHRQDRHRAAEVVRQ